ncbi:MAG: stalk domain-containing protein [Clostridia bacterium]|nr:stalk domain-containing protein [Clostridia bacterium]
MKKSLLFKLRQNSLMTVLVLSIAMLFCTVCTVSVVEPVYATQSYDDLATELATQVIINSYDSYIEAGCSVASSPSITDFDAYDIYILDEADVAVSQWVYEGNDIKTQIINMASETKNKENDKDAENNVNAKYVAYQYLGAEGLNLDSLAEDLKDILVARQNANAEGAFVSGDYSYYTNLPVFDALSRTGDISDINVEKGINYVLGLQVKDGENKGAFGDSEYTDYMSTTQAVRSLSAMSDVGEGYKSAEIETAINNALSWMKSNIEEDGGIINGWDNKLTDTAETIITLDILGESLSTWEHGNSGKSIVDYMVESAKNSDGTFGPGNMDGNIVALDAYNRLGANVAGTTAIRLSIEPDDVELAVEELQEFTVEAFLANGKTKDVTADANWTVSDEEKATINKEEGSKTVTATRDSKGDFAVEVSYQLAEGSVVVGTSVSPEKADVMVRIEGPEYTILPDTVISVDTGLTFTQILQAGQEENGYIIEKNDWGLVSAINGIATSSFWIVTPYQESYNNGDSFVMTGNGSTNVGELVLTDSAVQERREVTVTVTNGSGEPVEGATVIYYTTAKRAEPTVAGVSDAEGTVSFSIAKAGTYYVAADKANTNIYPSTDPDNGLVRTAAQELTVKKRSSGGGSGQTNTDVNITVKGKNNETLCSRNISLNDNDTYGVTPVGALKKTGLSFKYDSIDYIHTIAGQEPQGQNGWMFKVNGVISSVSANKYKLKNKDKVLWFYSTDSSNIPGSSGNNGNNGNSNNDDGSGGSILTTNQGTSKDYDDIISRKIIKDEEAIINLSGKAEKRASVSAKTVQELANNKKKLILKNEDVTVNFAPDALLVDDVAELLENENVFLELGAVKVSSLEKRKLLEKAPAEESAGLFDIGGKIVNLSVTIRNISVDGNSNDNGNGNGNSNSDGNGDGNSNDNGEGNTTDNEIAKDVEQFNKPVKVTIDLSDVDNIDNISEEEIAHLTAVRYEKDAQGNINLVKLGGEYNEETKQFTFYTDRFSFYGVVKARDLVNISMGINMLTVDVNGKREYLDVATMLINNRTMVPLRFIAESFQADVSWNDEERLVEIKQSDRIIQLFVDKTMLGLDTPPVIINGRTLVPVRYVSESLGARVTWLSDSKEVKIVK